MKRTILISLLLLCSLLNLKAVKWETYGPAPQTVDLISNDGDIIQLTRNSSIKYTFYTKIKNSNEWIIDTVSTHNLRNSYYYDGDLSVFKRFKNNVYIPLYNDSCLKRSNSGLSWEKVFAPNLSYFDVLKDTIYKIWRDTLFYATSLNDDFTKTKTVIPGLKNDPKIFKFERVSNCFFSLSNNKLSKTEDNINITVTITLPDTIQTVRNIYSFNDKLYVLIGNNIYVSDNLGATFTIFYSVQPGNIILSLNINDNDVLISTGLGDFYSGDLGNTYSKLRDNGYNSAINYLYVNSNEIYCSSHSGLNYSADTGKTWRIIHRLGGIIAQRNVTGSANTIIPINESGGAIILNKINDIWVEKVIKVPSKTPSIFMVSLIDNKLFADYGNLGLAYWNLDDNSINVCKNNVGNKFNYYLGFAIKKIDNQLYYLSSNGFMKGDKTGDNWTKIDTTNVRGEQLCFNNGYIFAGGILHNTDIPNIFDGTGIFRSKDGGVTWENLDNVMKGRPIKGLCAKYGNVFASSYGGIFMSSDNGDTWININDTRFGLLLGEIDANDDYLFAATGFSALGIARLRLKSSLECAQLVYPVNSAINVSGNPKLTWNAVEGALFYQIQVANDIDFKNIIYQGQVSDTWAQITGLNLNTKYYWRVKATFGAVKADWCQNYSFTVGGISGLNDINGEYINVAPNPSNGIINIETKFENEYDLNITIYNILGDVVYSGNNLKASGTIQIDLSGRSSGAYTAVIETGGKKYVKSINILK